MIVGTFEAPKALLHKPIQKLLCLVAPLMETSTWKKSQFHTNHCSIASLEESPAHESDKFPSPQA
jgi:hypothetical protein